MTINHPSIARNSAFQLEVDVTNTGSMAGEEIVQLYIRQKSGHSVVRPVKELKGFQKISLDPGQMKTVQFTITPDLLKHWSADMKYGVEPGIYDILVGRDSEDLQLLKVTLK